MKIKFIRWMKKDLKKMKGKNLKSRIRIGVYLSLDIKIHLVRK